LGSKQPSKRQKGRIDNIDIKNNKNNRYDKTFVKRPVFKVEITTRLLKDNYKVFYYLWRIKVKTTCNFGQKTIKSGCRFAWWFPEDGAAELYGWSKSKINILTGDTPP
jgi:hypothetical protein